MTALAALLLVVTVALLRGQPEPGQLQFDVRLGGVFLGAAALAAGRVAGRLLARTLRHGFAGLVLIMGVFVAAAATLGYTPTG